MYRSEIALVSLNVAVKDHTNKPVRELIAGDFAVFEDSVSQPIVSVSRQRIPLGLALLLDTSASMEGKLGLAQLAASEFVQRMAPDDQAAVIDFDNRVQVLQPFTNDVVALQAAINRTAAGGSMTGLPSDRSATWSAPRRAFRRCPSSNMRRIHDALSIASRTLRLAAI